MKLAALFSAVFAGLALAGSIPLIHVPPNCIDGYKAGQNVAELTIPYTYTEVLSIVGQYKNLTWAGNKPSTVTLNGTDNTIGTARMYTPPGGVSTIIETIDTYKKPPKNGPYIEIHTTNVLHFMGLKLYIPSDGQNFSERCGGRAMNLKFTADFCANNVSLGGMLLYKAHYGSAVEVGKLLGGNKFTSCAALTKMSDSAPMKGEAHPPVKMLGAGISVLAASLVMAFLLS